MNEQTQNALWDAIVIGGGIAGCSVAIHLSRLGHSVLLLERSQKAPMKMCGEFLSPEASSYLDELDVLDKVIALGGQKIDRFRITGHSGAAISGTLPHPAIGISRYTLDASLMRRAYQAGAVCKTGASVDAVTGSFDTNFTLTTSGEQFSARCVIGAYGKRTRLDQTLGRSRQASPYLALKAHYRGTSAISTIEVFGFRGGYVGIAPIEDGLVNLCLIAHKSAFDRAGSKAENLIELIQRENSGFCERLAEMERVSSLIGCSNITFNAKGCFENDICMVGDSAGMIAPLCGDGMAMALAGAKIASRHIDKYLRGKTSCAELKLDYDLAWKREFGVRMAVGNTLQWISMSASLSSSVLNVCSKLPLFTSLLIGATRGKVKRTLPRQTLAIH
jgi:flavin-dependent dehydrogenase